MNESNYWRSLDSHPDAGDSTPSEPWREQLGIPDEVTRRSMLGLMGASFALAGLTGCRRPVEHIVPYVTAPETLVPGVPRFYASTMTLGSEAIGVVVESHEGRPTKIEGNELHPGSRGGASGWAQASILDLYDPDRLQQPRRRGEDGSYEQVAWTDFEAFWGERMPDLDASGGAGLAVLCAAHASPSTTAVAAQLRERWPQARWVVWEPAGPEAAFAGLQSATGQQVRAVYHFDRARTVLALDADFLMTEPGSVPNARAFAAARRAHRDAGGTRLVAVESTLTVTGAAADQRIPLQSRLVGAFLGEVARALGQEIGTQTASLPVGVQDSAQRVAADLQTAADSGLVVVGSSQPPAVHAAAHAINVALGAVGTTVELHPLTAEVAVADPVGLAALTEAMRGGEVATLVMLGGNPAYDAPADFAFVEAISQVAHTVHLADRPNETSERVDWQLPAAHWLESWGDARSADGTLSVVQPLIAPLFEGRSSLELLSLLASGGARTGYELVRERWQSEVPEGSSFEKLWRRALHDGLLADSALPPVETELDASAVGTAWQEALAPGASGLEVTFRLCNSVHDGRFANNGWLQELPDPITKVTWQNSAHVSPTTAAELGLESGDIVQLSCRGRQQEATIWILPGQADGSFTLPLGYGRTAAGRVGDGVGFDAYALRHSAARWVDGELEISRTGRHRPPVQTQDHWSMEGRNLVREASLEHYREHPDFATEPERKLKLFSLWDEHEYVEGHQWGMTIDLDTCIGCNACVVACQGENNIPIVGPEQIEKGREMHWLRVDRYFEGEIESPRVVFQPVTCQHCENAPCEQVCPVAATVHDAEGLNAMVYNRCIGTRYCSNNCPYKVRRFNFLNFTKDTPELVQLAMNPNVTIRSRGVMEKCTFCLQRINGARIVAKREDRAIRDGDVRTACEQTCPTEAITFGDIADPESRVSKARSGERAYTLLAELNNRPRISYLARLRNPWEEA